MSNKNFVRVSIVGDSSISNVLTVNVKCQPHLYTKLELHAPKEKVINELPKVLVSLCGKFTHALVMVNDGHIFSELNSSEDKFSNELIEVIEAV